MCTPWRDSVYAATPLVVLNNFWKYLFVKIVARVLGPDHIVTSLEHLARHCARCSSDVTICPGPKTRANSFDKQVFPKFEYLSITIELA